MLGADLDEPGRRRDARRRCARRSASDTGEEVPTDPHDQLRAAIHAVFGSWSSRRANAYRKHWGISEDGGTAVIVQAMVFGNLGERLRHRRAVHAATRSPATPEPYGEWLPGGQGEDVVSGTPRPAAAGGACARRCPRPTTSCSRPARCSSASTATSRTSSSRSSAARLYLLQTRSAKRAPLAAVRTAVDLANEGAIERAEAVCRVSAEQLASGARAPLLAREVTDGAEVLARGVAACPGVASRPRRGRRRRGRGGGAGEDVVLARPTTSPEDVSGMIAARAVVTERGGSTSHAAVVTRALGRPSVVGVGEGVTGALGGPRGDGRRLGRASSTPGGWRPRRCRRGRRARPRRARSRGRASSARPRWSTRPRSVVDLDEAGSSLDPEDAPPTPTRSPQRLAGAPAARGSVLATAEGARAVVRSGVPAVVAAARAARGQPAAAPRAGAIRSEEER